QTRTGSRQPKAKPEAFANGADSTGCPDTHPPPDRRVPATRGGRLSMRALREAGVMRLALLWSAVSRLVAGQLRRPLADPVHRVLRAAAPPAQRFDPPGQPGLQVRGYLPGAPVGRRTVGTSLQDHVEGAVPGAVPERVFH